MSVPTAGVCTLLGGNISKSWLSRPHPFHPKALQVMRKQRRYLLKGQQEMTWANQKPCQIFLLTARRRTKGIASAFCTGFIVGDINRCLYYHLINLFQPMGWFCRKRKSMVLQYFIVGLRRAPPPPPPHPQLTV